MATKWGAPAAVWRSPECSGTSVVVEPGGSGAEASNWLSTQESEHGSPRAAVRCQVVVPEGGGWRRTSSPDALQQFANVHSIAVCPTPSHTINQGAARVRLDNATTRATRRG